MKHIIPSLAFASITLLPFALSLEGASTTFTGSSEGAQATGLYSTYWQASDINPSTGSAYGVNGTYSPSNVCSVYDSTSVCSVTASTYNYTA
jgi:hypothetical protein